MHQHGVMGVVVRVVAVRVVGQVRVERGSVSVS